MAGTGLPIPKGDNVVTLPQQIVPGSTGSSAAAWQSIAASGEKLANESASYLQKEIHQSQIGQIASFETDWRDKKTAARDQFANDPEGFKTWAQSSTDGAIAEAPSWMVPHAKQFLSREFESAYSSILSERRAQDKRLDGQAVIARTKMADDDVMSIASSGKLGTDEGKAAVETYKGVLDAAVNSGLMARDHAQFLTEDLTTRAQGTVIRNSVQQVYQEKGYEAARAHLDDQLQQFGAKYTVTDKIRTQTLGWLKSEEAGMRGERDGIAKEWNAAKGQLSTLPPDTLTDLQNRAYSVGAFKVGDDIQAHVSALNIVRSIRQLPQADQVRILASGNLDSRLAQRESDGDPTVVNKLGYVGTYQFGAPRLADLGVYTPGQGENLAGWSKTPANAPGKWSGTFNIPGFPDVKTLDDFRNNPGAQKAAYDLHQQRTDKEIDDLGLGNYVGQTVGGVPITRDGIRAMVHLAGANGALKTLSSGGAYNPADANGTTALDYARLGDSGASPGSLGGSRAGLIATGLLKKDMTQDLTKKITDFQAAVTKTEYPPMEEIGALGAQVHLLGNEEQKRQVAEIAAQAEYGGKFMQLPAPQRAELVSRWNEKLKTGATQYERHLADTVKTADAKITEEFGKDPYGAAYRFSEGIQALPAIDWSSPNVGDVLTAKVGQQNTIRADQGMGAFSALRPAEADALGAQLVNGDPRQSQQILGTLSRTLPADVYKETISAAPIRTALTGMMRTYDPAKLNVAMSTMDQAYRADPIGFKQSFGEGTVDRLQDWQARKDYLPPDQMAEYFKRADDPSFATARKQLMTDAEAKVSGLTPAKVANELGSVADRWVPFVNQAAPVDPIAGAALVADYDRVFKDRYVGTGDADKAKAQTVERLKTVWGPSSVADGALMRHPPERYYPQVDGSYDWMRQNVVDAINASRFGEQNIAFNPKENLPPDVAPNQAPAYSFKVMSDPRTEADVAAKRPPSYVVVVKDIASGRDTIPLDMSGQPMRFSFDPSSAQAAAREKFQTKRENVDLTAIGTAPGAIGNSP
jgi:hypothetical protein